MKRVLALTILAVLGCTKKDSGKNEVWIYTSLYKDTIAEMQPMLEKQFPDIKVNFFQAGSEEVASKISAEELAGGTKADVVIASDRFWYEEMAEQGKFHPYKPEGSDPVSETLKHPQSFYTTVSFPVMVMIYNTQAVKDAPKTFKEMGDPKWKGKFTTGSPLASGTNFTTVAFLKEKYGWDYFKALRKNDTISEGGNSSVIRRVQTKERPVGWVLLENVLRFQDTDKNMKIIYPDDGSILQLNILAITKKNTPRESAQKIADWMFSKQGQETMIHSYMYSVLPDFDVPRGAPPFKKILEKSHPWSQELLTKLMKEREVIKEQFTKIMFQ